MNRSRQSADEPHMVETAAYELLMIFTEENNLLPVGMEPNWSVEKSIKCMKITVSQTFYPLSIGCYVERWLRNTFWFLWYSLASSDLAIPLVETPYQRWMFICSRQNPKSGLSQEGCLYFSISLSVASADWGGCWIPLTQTLLHLKAETRGFGHTLCHIMESSLEVLSCREANHAGLTTPLRFTWDLFGRGIELLVELRLGASPCVGHICGFARERWMWSENPVGPFRAPRICLGSHAWGGFAALSPCWAACPGPLL